MTAPPTTDIAAFLLARLNEDEAAARAAAERECAEAVARGSAFGESFTIIDPRNPLTPARVLAQVAAMRRIVEMHAMERTDDPDGVGCETCDETNYFDGGRYSTGWPCDTLRALASIYADHDDYDAEGWAL